MIEYNTLQIDFRASIFADSHIFNIYDKKAHCKYKDSIDPMQSVRPSNTRILSQNQSV